MDVGAHPDRWSAVPVSARPVSLPWGLTSASLRAAVPDLDGEVTLTCEHEIRGLHERNASLLVTIRFRDVGGRGRTRVVFLKRTDPESGEAAKHRHLADLGVPVAPLLDVADSTAGPVIIAAFLPRIGIRPDEVDDLLELTARINAVTDAPQSLFRAASGDPQHDRRIASALATLRSLVGDRVPIDPDRWLRAYRRAASVVAATPTALGHNELAPQQVGWTTTGADARLVMIDLATMAWLPRFTDVAGLLAPMSELTGRPEDELIEVYLDHLSRQLGRKVSGPAAHREVITVRLTRDVEALPWWLGPDAPPEVEPADRIAARMSADLARLGLLTDL